MIYARCSTLQQHVSNQLIELRQTAERFGWVVVSELVDDRISGAEGKPAQNAAWEEIWKQSKNTKQACNWKKEPGREDYV